MNALSLIFDSLPLLISVAGNYFQHKSAQKTREQDYNIAKQRLELDKLRLNIEDREKKAAREQLISIKKQEHEFKLNSEKSLQEHELEKMKLNDSIYIHQALLPKLQDLFADFVSTTNQEISQANSSPIVFSTNQKHKEILVSLYCPDIHDSLISFHEINNTGTLTTEELQKELFLMLNNEIVPILATKLSKLQ